MKEKGTKNEEIIGIVEAGSASGTGYTLFFTSDNILVTEAPHQRLQLAIFGITWLILTLLLTFIVRDLSGAAVLSSRTNTFWATIIRSSHPTLS